jgi:hypothetical protein
MRVLNPPICKTQSRPVHKFIPTEMLPFFYLIRQWNDDEIFNNNSDGKGIRLTLPGFIKTESSLGGRYYLSPSKSNRNSHIYPAQGSCFVRLSECLEKCGDSRPDIFCEWDCKQRYKCKPGPVVYPIPPTGEIDEIP